MRNSINSSFISTCRWLVQHQFNLVDRVNDKVLIYNVNVQSLILLSKIGAVLATPAP